MTSIVQDLNDEYCFVCGSTRNLELHHIMHGTANRRLSTRYKLTCWLCKGCHTGKNGVHHNAVLNRHLQQVAQTKFEETHTHEEWMKLFKKNYL